jgi:hypothetical protein
MNRQVRCGRHKARGTIDAAAEISSRRYRPH